jgi:hypothetical protein
MAYHPPQRAVGAFILSLDHWIRATFHLPKLHAFEEHLARDRAFFSLTNVAFGEGTVLEFLALRASVAHLVVPEVAERELRLQPVAGTSPRDVSCYLEHVAVHGTLELLSGVRTSDFLEHQEGFIMLRACRIVPALAGRPEPVPVVFVNARAILAVAEEGGHVGGRRSLSVSTAAMPRGRRVPA